MIVPGFQDAHVHPAFGARNLRTLNLDHLDTPAEYLDAIGAYAAAHPDLDWITGGGWASTAFPGGIARAEDLDAVAPGRAIFLLNNDVHGAWVSSEALRRGGVHRNTPDPWDGRIERDAEGEPIGTLTEGAAYTFQDEVLPPVNDDEWRACLLRAQRELHALGITGWQDAWVTPDLLAVYRSLDAAGELTMRAVTSLWWDRHRGLEQIEELVELRAATPSTGQFDAGTVKIMLDGCPENGTGAMLDPYLRDETLDRGIAFVETEPLAEAVTRLDSLGFQIHFHALGDRAVRIALDAVEAAREANGPRDARHHIAHLQLPDAADIPRLRSLGVIANLQPYWAQHDPGVERLSRPLLGDERFGRFYPTATIMHSGAVTAFGSDWPVSTPDPLRQIEVALTRESPEAREGEPWRPEERIALPEALAAFTRGSAYVNRDDDAGTIEPGKRADLAVLDRNLFEPEHHASADAHVEMTIASGQVVHGE
jgi:predicted amidohydrolase YtcJ